MSIKEQPPQRANPPAPIRRDVREAGRFGLSQCKAYDRAVAAKQKYVNIQEAKTHFSKLLKRVVKGEEVIIARAGRPIARLSPLWAKPGKRVPGSAKGMFTISDDFDAPLPDLERVFEE